MATAVQAFDARLNADLWLTAGWLWRHPARAGRLDLKVACPTCLGWHTHGATLAELTKGVVRRMSHCPKMADRPWHTIVIQPENYRAAWTTRAGRRSAHWGRWMRTRIQEGTSR